MPTAVQPWKEIESDPEYVALPEMDRGKVFEWWKGQVRSAAKEEGSPDEEIESELNAFTAQLGTRNATGAALTASEVMTAPLRMDWERPADSLGGIAIEPGSERVSLPPGTDILPTVPNQDTGQGRFMSAMNAVGQTAMRIGGGALQSAGELLEGPQPGKVLEEIEGLRAVMAEEQPGVSRGDMAALKRYTAAYNRIRALEPDLEGRGELTSGAGMAMREKAGDVFQTNPKFSGEFWADVLPRGAGSLIPLALTRDPKLAAGLMGSSTFVEQRDANIARGMPEDEAVGRALATAATEAGLEYVGGKAVTGTLGKALGAESRAARAGVAAGGEGLTEGSQNVSAAVINQQPIDFGMLMKETAAGALLGGGSSVMFDPDTGIVRTPGGAVKDGRIIAESSPDAIAAQAMKGLDAVKPTDLAVVEPAVEQVAQIEPEKGQVEVQNVPPTEATAVPGEIPSAENRATTEGQAPKLDESTPGAPEPVRNLGPGAANIEEPLRQFTTSNKEATVNQERAARALDPVIKEARITNQESIDRAEAVLEQNPKKAVEIVERLRTNPQERTISLEDSAVMLVERTKLRTERDSAAEVMNDESLSPEDRAEAQSKFEAAEAGLSTLDQAAQDARSTWGRFGNLWQRSMRSDYTLEPMKSRARVAKGEGLTPEEAEQIKVQSEVIAKNNEAMEQREQSAEDAARIKAAEATLAAAARFSPGLLERARKWVEAKEAMIDSGRQRARELMQQIGMKLGANPLHVKEVYELTKILANEALVKLGRGVYDATKFGADMIKEFGDAVTPYLKKAWAAANREWDGSPAKPRQKSKKQQEQENTAAEDAASTEDGIKALAEKGELPDDMGNFVKQLANDYVKSGANTVDAVMAKLHAFLDPIIPMNDRQLLDLWTDYGKGKEATKDPTQMLQQQIRGEALLTDQILALEAGEQKLGLTGQQRVAMRDQARQLREKLNELKKKLPVPEGDPAKRLQTTLDTMEKRTKNRIADLRFEIAKGERTIKQRGVTPTSPKLEALRAELAQVEAEHLAVFGKREATPEQKLKAAISAAERAEERATQELANAKRGVFAKPITKGTETRLEVLAIRARSEAARAETEALRKLANPPMSAAQKRLDAALVSRERWDQMLAGEIAPASKQPRETLSELENDARAEIAAMRELAAEIRRDAKPGVDPDNATVKALEKAAAEYERRVNELDFSAKGKKQGADTERVANARALRNAAYDAYAAAKKAATPQRSPEEIAIARRKAIMTRQIADIADRTARGDFGPKPKKPPLDLSKDPAAVKLAAETARVKSEFAKRVREWQLAKRTRVQKAIDFAKDLAATPRNLLASLDDSAIGRQGWFLMLGEPWKLPGRIVDSFRQMLSKRGHEEAMTQLTMRPNAEFAKKSGLELTSEFLNEGKPLNQREEHIRSSLLHKIPGVKVPFVMADRAFTGTLDKLSADIFDAMVWMNGGAGKTTAAEGKFFADAVNVFRGRGGKKPIGPDTISTYAFSIRWFKSLVEKLALRPIWRDLGNPDISLKSRAIVAERYVRYGIGLGIVYAVALALGAKVEKDPRSSSFGEIRIGDMRIEPTGGSTSLVTFLSRLIGGESKTSGGEIAPLRKDYRAANLFREWPKHDEPEYGARTGQDVVADFLGNKLAPIPAQAWQASSGMSASFDSRGKKIPWTPERAAISTVIPITPRETAELYKKEKPVKAAIGSILNFFGFSTKSYPDRR